MAFFNISNILRLVLQTNVARAELYVQDGTDVIQIVPTQIAVRQGSRQIVLLPTGFVMNNTGGETTTRYNADGILTVVTSAGASPFNISTSSGLKLQNISGTIGQIVTADSGGNARWQNAPFVGTATSNLSMGTKLITATTTIGITKPLLPSTITYNVSNGTNIVGTIGYTNKAVLAADTNSTTNNATNYVNLAITTAGVYIVWGFWSINNNNAGTLTLPRVGFQLDFGASGLVGSSYGLNTVTNIVLGTAPASGPTFNYSYSTIYNISTISSPNNFITLSLLTQGASAGTPATVQANLTYLQYMKIA